MRIALPISLLASTVLLSACGGAPDEANDDSAVTTAEAPAPDAADPAPAATGGPDKGKIAFLRCQSCHTLQEGGPHLTGPNLHGLFGATAGEKEGYAFSEALAGSGIVWTAETLDAWIEAPRDVVPGNKMAFAGLPEAEQRAALIEYLERETR